MNFIAIVFRFSELGNIIAAQHAQLCSVTHLQASFPKAEADSPPLQTLSEASLYQCFTGCVLVSPVRQPPVSSCPRCLWSNHHLVFMSQLAAAGLTWCLSAETAGCLGGAGMSRPPKHPETKVGCEPGCYEEAALG